ncbi:MAG: GFA family protein, partial [Mesorhizobium sp.]
MSETNRKRRLLGSCLCQAVCYQVTDAFIFAANCHCAACRRTTGSAFKAFARIHGEELTVIR